MGEKTKTLISCTVTAQLICVFVFAYEGCWVFYAAVKFIVLWSSLMFQKKIKCFKWLMKVKYSHNCVHVDAKYYCIDAHKKREKL